MPGQFIAQEQGLDLALDTQVRRSADRQSDPVVVPGLAQTDAPRQGADAHHLLLVILEHEQVIGIGPVDLSGEGALGPANPVGQAFFIGRQAGKPRNGLPHQREQGGQVGDLDRTDNHGAVPCARVLGR
ncbi:hypothetical protein D3C76_1025510 [compost metagenome]